MESGDGMLVRLRLVCGILTPDLARAIAGLAERHGSGLIDLSSRANLQLRGITSRSLPALTESLDELGLLDADPEAEAIRNILASPLAGVDPAARLDIRPVVEALDRHLRNDVGLRGLPGKFAFVVDDGGSMPLDTTLADIAFVAEDAGRFQVFRGGRPAGTCRPDQLVDRAAELARECLADEGRQVTSREGRLPPVSIGFRRLGSLSCLGVGVPFGRLIAADLAFLARVAEASSGGELRLTCWRSILIVGQTVPETLPGTDLILDENHPLRAVAACPGAPACNSAHADTRTVGARLAREARSLGAGVTLHVSGCAKGCARPLPTAVTLVGTADGYDLVRGGRAGDTPVRRGIPTAELETVFDQGVP